MRSTAWIWRIASVASIVTTILLLCGFIYAVRDIMNPSAEHSVGTNTAAEPKATSPGLPPGQTGVVVIGDSLAKGTGDDEGKGFARRTVDLLQAENKAHTVKLLGNLGINGLTTQRLVPMLEETGVQHMLKEANVILLSIGGNDLFAGAQAMQTGDLPTEQELEASVVEASKRLKTIVGRIHSINPDARLVYIGLYNPFSDLKDMREIGNQAVARWNRVALDIVNGVAGANVTPTYDLFVNNLSVYISGDHFHPNGDGYQQIAERIVQGLD
ncbi:hypothetical protein DCC85_12360 [Paenibacillus sp. CAA11]|uniref:GDSL-type esterase/lipase family protein n=1 Tax=Paenibacillus sp. CAA11 TaxID=1532905 RepID=UPI000D397154|nr:GDSL-type esterase/lipase family protein [Paenibacillus sp. CAA11]AWB44934.1 hypothetical protein DCC85_12360 [Paenibacillus sp. CAA11]